MIILKKEIYAKYIPDRVKLNNLSKSFLLYISIYRIFRTSKILKQMNILNYIIYINQMKLKNVRQNGMDIKIILHLIIQFKSQNSNQRIYFIK